MRIYRLISAIALEILFILLKATGKAEMNIGAMLLPAVIFIAIEIISMASALIVQIYKKSSKDAKDIMLLILLQIILISIKLLFSSQLQCISWILILIPIEIPILGVLMIISGMKVFKIIEGKKDKE